MADQLEYGISTSRQRAIPFEVLMVVAATIAIPIVSQFLGETSAVSSSYQAFTSVVYSLRRDLTYLSHLAVIALAIYVSGDALEMFGLRGIKPLRDLLAASAMLALSVLIYVATSNLFNRTPFAHLAVPNPAAVYASNPLPFLAGTSFMVLSCLYQELLFRGYLLVRGREIFHSLPLAIVVSTLAFGALHVYQGGQGILTATLDGLVYALVTARLGSIWPAVLAHFLHNFLIGLAVANTIVR